MIASRKALIVVAAFVLMAIGLPWGGNVPAALAQISVTAADPPTGEQGTLNLNVTIKGKGFKNGAKAKFYKTGTTDPAGVNVKSTQYVSSTQLVALVDIADTAALDLFDIEVRNADGRTGKGTELFSVLAKKIDPCTVPDPLPTLSPNISGPPGVPGYLDSAFGNGMGKVISFRGFEIRGVAIQDIDGESRIIAAGSTYDQCQGASRFWTVVRYRSDGMLDTSFGVNGAATAAFAQPAGLYGVTIDSSNRIVVVGNAPNKQAGQNVPAVARLNENGTFDTTFGTGGIVTVPNGKASGGVNSVALQSDGRIVIVGSRSGSYLSVIRLNTNGTPDAAFNSTGEFVYTGARSAGFAVTTQWTLSGEQIVVAGFGYNPTTGQRSGALWRLTKPGKLDPAFGGTGSVLTTFDGFQADFNAVAVDDTNRIVAAGYRNTSGAVPAQVALARYGENGALDPLFDGDGRVVVQSEFTSYGLALAIQSDGGIVVAGSSNVGAAMSPSRMAFWRFTDIGVLDSTFADGGAGVDPITTDASFYGQALVRQSDGRFVVAGWGRVGSAYITYAALVRFWQ